MLNIKRFWKLNSEKDKRHELIKKNIIYSFFVKGFGILTSLLLVPVTIGFLNTSEYGIWLTLNSILLWINTFDIGLGNGLRNKLTEALVENDLLKAKTYISTAYITITVFMVAIFIVFQIINNYVDWYSLLNIKSELVPNLKSIISMSFIFFCISFVLKLVGNILLAMQKSAAENFLIMMGQFLSLVIIFIVSHYFKGTLWIVAFIYSISPVVVFACAYPFVFSGVYKKIRPNIFYFKKEYIKSIMSLGTQFFVLQIAGLVIFSSSNLIITNMFGPEMVTKYNIAFRYFNIIPLIFAIVLTPIWSATTDAYINNDYGWILKSLKKIKLMLLGTFFVLFIMVCLSNFVYKIWIGNKISIPLNLSIAIAVYILLFVSSLSYSSFLNGLGKLRVQMINVVFCAIFFLPITYYLGSTFGIVGVVVSLTLVNLSGLVLNVIQFNLILSKKAKGIWNK